jgi:hypothetical protein
MNVLALTLDVNSIIKNEQHTTGGLNWKSYWQDKTNLLFIDNPCCVCGSLSEVGAHVSGLGFHNPGIVPLCKGCNNKRGKELKTTKKVMMATLSESEVRRLVEKKLKAQAEIDKLEDDMKQLCVTKNYYWVVTLDDKTFHRKRGCSGAVLQSNRLRVKDNVKCSICCKKK